MSLHPQTIMLTLKSLVLTCIDHHDRQTFEDLQYNEIFTVNRPRYLKLIL